MIKTKKTSPYMSTPLNSRQTHACLKRRYSNDQMKHREPATAVNAKQIMPVTKISKLVIIRPLQRHNKNLDQDLAQAHE